MLLRYFCVRDAPGHKKGKLIFLKGKNKRDFVLCEVVVEGYPILDYALRQPCYGVIIRGKFPFKQPLKQAG